MRLRLRHVAGLVAFASTCLVFFAGCGERRPPRTRPGMPSSFAPGCGLQLFTDPRCEALVDARCCAQQDQCARDPGCAAIAQCWSQCDQQAAAKKARGMSDACGCMGNCFPQGAGTPGYAAFMQIGQWCDAGGTPNLSCGGQC